tara:strand:+ start:4383 stop:6686 length:2304 start_codon:yes stop_codon:yes gene_type:complete
MTNKLPQGPTSDLPTLAIDGGEPYRTKPFGPRWVFGDDDFAELKSVMERAPSAWRTGHKVREFIQDFQTLFNVKNGVATGCGTSAVHAAVAALDAEPGDEIITTPATDIGSVIGILQQNLVPIFVDWDKDTFNMAPADIERKITDRTRAILVVHLFGFPCDMTAIRDLATRYRLPIIEDCAQAHLAEHNGSKVGTFGEYATYSFGLKTLSTDQGGMVTTPDPDLAALVRGFLSKGSTKIGDNWVPYHRLGSYSPMTDLQAAIGVAQLSRLEDATQRREMVASHLDEVFSEIPCITLPRKKPGDRCVYYVYPYSFDSELAGHSVSHFIKALKAEGVADSFGPYLHGQALHQRPLFLEGNTYGRSGYPFRDPSGALRVDYSAVHLPKLERSLAGLGYFHMRNSFELADAEDMVGAIHKVARGLGLKSSRHQVLRPPGDSDMGAPGRNAGIERHGETSTQTPSRQSTVDEPTTSSVSLDEILRNAQGRVHIPSGTYHVQDPLIFAQKRNLHLIGSGGNPGETGTTIVFNNASLEAGLALRSAMHCRFEGITFKAGENGPDALIQLCCDEAAGNGVSTNAIEFMACTFNACGRSKGIIIQDSANIVFRQCWFIGQNDAVRLGVPMQKNATTRSNGLANSITFEHCHIFERIVGDRAACISFETCMFSKSDQYAGGEIDFGASDSSEVINISVRNCFAVEASGGTFFRQGAKGSGLTFENNRITGYDCAINLDGLGWANIRGNTFGTQGKSAPDINMNGNEKNCKLEANRFY